MEALDTHLPLDFPHQVIVMDCEIHRGIHIPKANDLTPSPLNEQMKFEIE